MNENNIAFQDLGLSAPMLQALENKGYGYPTSVQREAIPPLMAWKDVIAKAPTGTGKTFAFGIPMIEHIDPESQDLQGLILAPTRELAIQIGDELRGLLTYYKGIRVAVTYGGASINTQIRALEKKPQIVVATPGRLMDHYNRKTLRLDKVKTVILDEADRMLDMGFFKDVTRIIEKVKNRVNLGLFSATISQEVMTVSWMYQRDEVEITVEPKQEDKPDIDQFYLTCTPLEKEETTLRLIRTQGFERVIIFCNTKHMCQRLCDDFQRAGADAACIHGDIKQNLREKTMQQYREGKLGILIATDVASRGIDVDDVDCVVNFDVPEENEYYIHRIGRTGRAKKKGVAWSIVGAFPEKAKLDEIAKYSNFVIFPMKLNEDGSLTQEEIKEPVVKKAFPLMMQETERGFMLLCSCLGDPERRILSPHQFRILRQRTLLAGISDPQSQVTDAVLIQWGYRPEEARRICALLSQETLLDHYLRQAQRLGITLCTRISPNYPQRLLDQLGQSAPAVLTLWGDLDLLDTPAISVVGTREPSGFGAAFAAEAGRQAAQQGYTLVSGNARGCGRIAQDAALAAGGGVISIVADRLLSHCQAAPSAKLLYCSETGFDLPFTPQRALCRNLLIHALGQKVIAIQPGFHTGGTWAGTAENLKKGWSPVFVAADGCPGAKALCDMGAYPAEPSDLADLGALRPAQVSLF